MPLSASILMWENWNMRARAFPASVFYYTESSLSFYLPGCFWASYPMFTLYFFIQLDIVLFLFLLLQKEKSDCTFYYQEYKNSF